MQTKIMKTSIGIKPEDLAEVAQSLNRLLADETILYIECPGEGDDHNFCKDQPQAAGEQIP